MLAHMPSIFSAKLYECLKCVVNCHLKRKLVQMNQSSFSYGMWTVLGKSFGRTYIWFWQWEEYLYFYDGQYWYLRRAPSTGNGQRCRRMAEGKHLWCVTIPFSPNNFNSSNVETIFDRYSNSIWQEKLETWQFWTKSNPFFVQIVRATCLLKKPLKMPSTVIQKFCAMRR